MPELPNRVTGSKRHRCVVAPGAGGLPMRAIANHVGAFERAAGPELVGNAQRVADGKPIDAVAQCWFRFVCHGKLLLHFGLEMRGNQRQYVQLDSRRSTSRIERTQWSICQNGMHRRLFTRQQAFLSGVLPLVHRRVVPRWKLWTPCAWCHPSMNPTVLHLSVAIPVLS